MPELPEVYPKPLDLTRYTEATRRELYDRLVSIQFTPQDPPLDPEDAAPVQDPDAAGLTVFYLFGRWFAYWQGEPEPGLPSWRLTEMVRIQAADTPDGIMLYEV
ncbi:MAG TPA: hypothetical protein VKK31_26740 [Thermoanaerobaculia bacterium]|nr:hypothetical protein [Thermoanaerobaculia bacterium]